MSELKELTNTDIIGLRHHIKRTDDSVKLIKVKAEDGRTGLFFIPFPSEVELEPGLSFPLVREGDRWYIDFS